MPEREAPPAFYFPPAPDGSRPGIYFINTFDPSSRPLHRLASTTYHEAVPGHHFQITIETELQGLPAFRRLGSRLTGAAFPEGWGLYSERLADEMGLFEDPRERFGMLDAQAYKTGQRAIETLRRQIEARDGGRFDLMAFHDAVLGHGSLPLATLTRELPNWVAPGPG